jgi:hypothetical protein
MDKRKTIPTLSQPAVTSSYLFDWNTIKDNIIEPEYFMGVDTYDKKMNAYCLTRRVDGITEILLSKVIKDENDFEKEVENLANYFNAKVFRSPVG